MVSLLRRLAGPGLAALALMPLPGLADTISNPVAEFSGLDERLANPISTYSTGMLARLRFSILTSLRPQVLVMDEGVATADAAFATKAADRLREFHDSAEIVVMSSHGMNVAASTDTVLWLEKGRVRALGEPHSTVKAYLDWAKEEADRGNR